MYAPARIWIAFRFTQSNVTAIDFNISPKELRENDKTGAKNFNQNDLKYFKVIPILEDRQKDILEGFS